MHSVRTKSYIVHVYVLIFAYLYRTIYRVCYRRPSHCTSCLVHAYIIHTADRRPTVHPLTLHMSTLLLHGTAVCHWHRRRSRNTFIMYRHDDCDSGTAAWCGRWLDMAIRRWGRCLRLRLLRRCRCRRRWRCMCVCPHPDMARTTYIYVVRLDCCLIQTDPLVCNRRPSHVAVYFL